MERESTINDKLIKKAEDMGFYTKSSEKALEFILDEMSRLSAVEKSSQDAANILNSYNDFYNPNTGDASLSDIFTIIDQAISKFNVNKNSSDEELDSESLFNKRYDEFISHFKNDKNNTDWSKANNRHASIQSFDFSSPASESSDDYIAFSDSIKDWTLSELLSKSMAVNASDKKIKDLLKILFEKGYIK